MPGEPGLEHLLDLCEPSQDGVAGRELEGLPHRLARNLALDPGEVREETPERRPTQALGQVQVDGVVERELAGVAQLEEARGDEGLRDRRDRILGLGGRLAARLDVGEADGLRPDELRPSEDRSGDARGALARLRGLKPP